MQKLFLILGVLGLFTIASCSSDKGTNQDDKDKFETVTIGNQVWMQKNLDVTHYRNGDSIPNVKDSTEWANLTTGAWCYENNDPENGKIYGKLYNWYAVNDPRGIVPEGWRVPSDKDWAELELYMGMTQEQTDSMGWRGSPAGAKLAGGYDLWITGDLSNHTDFNSSGFSGLPGSWRNHAGNFSSTGYLAIWWSSTEYNSSHAISRRLYCYNTNMLRGSMGKSYGLSVRCVKDE
jgi:uncharacterized protein (TIGR02145 family)